MFNIFFSSDLHFNHNRQFVYEPRGFQSIEEMNETIIERFNSIVKPEDTLYLLGDTMLGQDIDAGLSYLKRLNGNIKLIRGNHDTNRRIEAYQSLDNVEYLGWADVVKINKRLYYLSHYPTFVNNFAPDGMFNLCGHLHTKNPFEEINKGYIYHVEVDAHNCYPISIEEIEQTINNFFGHK